MLSKLICQRVALAAIGASILLAPIAVNACELVLSEHRSGREVLHWPIQQRPIQFSVSFVHSVLGTPVSDVYEARFVDGQWKTYLIQETHRGQGYGLPYSATSPGETYVHTENGWQLTMNRLVYPLVQLPLPSQRITLHSEGRRVLFGDLSPRSILVEVRDCELSQSQ